MICFVGTMKKIQIQSVKFPRDLSRIYCIDPIICVCKIHHPSSVHNAMKMAAARPQSVFTADVYLSDNQAAHLRLLSAQDVRVAGWTTVGDGVGRKNRSGTYVINDCVITTEVRLCLCCLRLT